MSDGEKRGRVEETEGGNVTKGINQTPQHVEEKTRIRASVIVLISFSFA